ncbi:MAG: TPM domain-containing protein [Rhodospirillales bacterium]
MAFLTDADRQRIEQAVEDAETKTSGEFVTVVAEDSDDYLYIPTLAAACLVFVLSGVALLVPVEFGLLAFYAGQVVGFIALALAFRWPPVKMRLVPKAVQRRRARRLAHQVFLDLGLSSTKERTGVLLFVSAAEHYVEIIADRGIQQHVDNAVWERIVADFVGRVREGRIADGFVQAIEASAAVMAEHHPWHPGVVNELPNRLIEI